MPNTLQTELTVILATVFTGVNDLSTPSDRMNLDLSDVLDNGTGLDQADLPWADSRTLAGVTSENLDLAGLLTNSYGATITFARIKCLILKLKTLTAGYKLEYGGAAANAFPLFKDPTDVGIVRAGGFDIKWVPDLTAFAVTAGTGDILKINNPNANPVDYDIVLIGASV